MISGGSIYKQFAELANLSVSDAFAWNKHQAEISNN